MRILFIACLLFLLFGAATLPVAGAAHQICLPQVPGQLSIAQAQSGALLLNEVVVASSTSWICPGATLPQAISDTSWIEIYNPQNQPIDLYASHVSIDSGGGSITPVRLPFGAAIAAQGFFTFFISQGLSFFGNHVPFSLRLLISDTVVDQVTLPVALGANQSYARVSDGALTWQISDTPTIGISNVLPTPTPVPTLKPTHTPTVRHTKATHDTSKGHITVSKSKPVAVATSSEGDTVATVSSGIQPAWSGLHLPGAVPSAQTSSSPTTTYAATGPPAAGSDAADMLRNVLFITLTVVFIGGLYWVWRRFKRSRSRP